MVTKKFLITKFDCNYILFFLQEDDLPELPNGVPETESPDGKKKRKIAEDFLNEPKAPLEETWEPLEPHEVVTIAKPIRKGIV